MFYNPESHKIVQFITKTAKVKPTNNLFLEG